MLVGASWQTAWRSTKQQQTAERTVVRDRQHRGINHSNRDWFSTWPVVLNCMCNTSSSTKLSGM